MRVEIGTAQEPPGGADVHTAELSHTYNSTVIAGNVFTTEEIKCVSTAVHVWKIIIVIIYAKKK